MQQKLHMVTIEDLVPQEHLLRKLEATLDLTFLRTETAEDHCLLSATALNLKRWSASPELSQSKKMASPGAMSG